MDSPLPRFPSAISSHPPKIPCGGFSLNTAPRLAFQVGLPRALTTCSGLLPPFVHTDRVCYLAQSRGPPSGGAPPFERRPAALPQGLSLRSGLCCPGPSTLNQPHPPHSQAPCHFPAVLVIGRACSRPTTAWAHERFRAFTAVPSLHVAPYDPGEPSGCTRPASSPWHRPSPRLERFGTPKTPPSVSSGRAISGLLVSLPLQPAESLASLTDLTRLTEGGSPVSFTPLGRGPSGPTETFTPGLSDGSVALPAAGYDYGGGWAPPPTGLPPAGTAASLAAPNLLLVHSS